MIVRHIIIMSSSYSDGTRIALDFSFTGIPSVRFKNEVESVAPLIKKECGKGAYLSTHSIVTEGYGWNSVEKADPYFEGVKVINSVDEFIKKIKKDRSLLGVDVANYILSQVSCSHLSLEKLVYFAYADYLCKTSKRLFTDNIYAFSYGPVVESVYGTYKKSGNSLVEPRLNDLCRKIPATVDEMPIQSRILFAEDGCDKLLSIKETIKDYGILSARELVNITHRRGSPWSYVDSTKRYQQISDELILKYHYVENVS